MEMTETKARPSLWDRIGIGLSALCMLHCLALPVVLTGLTAAAVAESFHFWVALFIVPVVLLAAVPSYRAHRRRSVVWLFAAGVVLLFGALLVEPFVGAAGENAVTVTGGVLLITGHWVNWHTRPHGPA
jgi:hypothetical protein